MIAQYILSRLSRFLDERVAVRKDMDMGNLCNALSGNGFLGRNKRSTVSENPEVLYSRQFARFRVIPAVEGEDSE